MSLLRLIKLEFLPRSPGVALLVLRVWLGLSMLLLHGMGKLRNFGSIAENFPALFISPTVSLGLTVFAEVLCAALLVVGLGTRFAALSLSITMAVAFFVAHGGVLSGEGSGEMAFIYMAGYLVLFLAGGGSWSLDGMTGGSRD